MKVFLAPLIAGVLAASVLTGHATEAQTRHTRSALIIAVSQYESPDISTLKGVPHDVPLAKEIAKGMEIGPDRITVLQDSQATKQAILAAMDRLSDSVAEGGRVLIYFSGHGTRWYNPGTGKCAEGLLAYDGRPITNEEIAQRTTKINAVADKVIVVFDACHSAGVGDSGAILRSIAATPMTPKFFLKNGEDAEKCSQPVNVLTRSLFNESIRLGALSENFVQIASARADEVSYDEPNKGGLATQGLHKCLLGAAIDRDASGAVSMREVQECTQEFVNQRLKPWPNLIAHNVTVSGNRNIVPVSTVRPEITPPAEIAQGVGTQQSTVTPEAAPPTPVTPVQASLATLRELEAQSNPRRKVDVRLNSDRLKIGRDALELQVTSNRDGFVYLLLAGSDARSFYVLYPNGLDKDNAIQAGRTIKLPRPDWRLVARGPEGVNHLLVLVTDTPRDLSVLTQSPLTAAEPFTFALNDPAGRSLLQDFMTGRGVGQGSESFGSRLLTVEEVR
jgi:hypothetical protein